MDKLTPVEVKFVQAANGTGGDGRDLNYAPVPNSAGIAPPHRVAELEK